MLKKISSRATRSASRGTVLVCALLLGACAFPSENNYASEFLGHFDVVQTSNPHAPLSTVDLKFEENGYGYIAMRKPDDNAYVSVHLYRCRSFDIKLDGAQVSDYPSHQVRCAGDDGRGYYFTMGPAGLKLGKFASASGYAFKVSNGYVASTYSLDRSH